MASQTWFNASAKSYDFWDTQKIGTGTDQIPVKSHYLLPAGWHSEDCRTIFWQPEIHPNTLGPVLPPNWL